MSNIPLCSEVERAASPVVVLPTCERDCQMHMKSLEWMVEMDGQQSYDAILSHDNSMRSALVNEMLSRAKAAFKKVDVFTYQFPGVTNWPWVANIAFQSAAWHIMNNVGRAWFWMEADCVPLKPGWLRAWFADYAIALANGKSIMGAVVDGRGHCNGTAIYPADFPNISPRAMQSTGIAWDWEMKDDTVNLTYNSNLLVHCWGTVNGQLHPWDGPAMVFQTVEQVKTLIRPDAVLFHRAKFGDLIDRLREMRGLTATKTPVPLLAGGGGGGGNRTTFR
jgi:hypothetical protein